MTLEQSSDPATPRSALTFGPTPVRKGSARNRPVTNSMPRVCLAPSLYNFQSLGCHFAGQRARPPATLWVGDWCGFALPRVDDKTVGTVTVSQDHAAINICPEGIKGTRGPSAEDTSFHHLKRPLPIRGLARWIPGGVGACAVSSWF